jgi:hypothetical protein
MSDPCARVKVLERKEVQEMNSLYENRNMLESAKKTRIRLADSICSECGYACFAHTPECSNKK